MIYVARIDDAFARFKLQRPIFSRYPRSAFSFSKRYKFPVSNSQREKYYISNSYSSVNLIESRADFFSSPPPRLSFYQLIQSSSILSLIAKLSFVNEGFFFTPSKKKEKLTISRESKESKINQLGYIEEKGARIYIYIVEDGYFSRGSAVIGKWRSVQFPNHRDLEGGRRKKREVSTDRSLNPGYYREKLAGKFSSSFSLSSSIIEPCNAVSSTRIDRVFTRHATAAAAANISAGRSEYFAGLLPPLSLSLSRTCHRWNASPSRVVMPSEACDISCHASRRARGTSPPRRGGGEDDVLLVHPFASANSRNVS